MRVRMNMSSEKLISDLKRDKCVRIHKDQDFKALQICKTTEG